MALELIIKKKLAGFTLEAAFSAGAERLGLLGASGCGKSMTLRCIAGVSVPDEGRISINGKTVYDSARGINLPPQKRRAGYLFQQYALFPHLTVRQNIALVLGRLPRGERKRLTAEILAKFSLEDLADQKSARLSGGQQQRAALARMLAPRPEIIMLDEPFSALDSFLRDAVEKELRETVAAFPGTVLFVSHNRDEVYRFCERMIILDQGRITRMGDRDELFRDPRTVAAARLSGCKNIAPARKTGGRRVFVPQWNLSLCTAAAVPDDLSHVGIRAHHIRRPRTGDRENVFTFSISALDLKPFSRSEYITPAGGEALVRIIEDAEGTPFRRVEGEAREETLCLSPEHLLLLRE
ncbi:MAG: ATP-binding cassette domain-containing protein [Treponema sp.]|nr:ATP-binding cassette domain-containing protein [Treponema sp.]